MSINPLQFIIIIAGLIFFLFAVDAFARKKFNILHFIVFFGGTLSILIFVFNVELLNKFGSFFGLNRGADLLVYASIILLAYFYFEILNRVTKQSHKLSKIMSEQAIQEVISNGILDNLVKIKGDKSKYIFLMRAYNEGKMIGEVIDNITQNGFSKILIVNDGSTDNTLNVVSQKKFKYKKSNIIILSHLINRGGGAANKTGFEFLRKYGDLLDVEWVITFDSDGQMEVKDTEIFIKTITKGKYDIILGSRFITGGKAENIPFGRKLILFGSKIITFFFNGLWLSDPHNGFRFIKLELFKDLKIYSDHMAYASELLDEIKRLGVKYTEIPVNISYTDYSLKKGQKNSNALKIFLELIYKRFFFR
ncbi:DUF2304 family protein [Candidatus Gracilibacteria bacterium]|nr:DUF2304 family protein [Candidatus Gracilibacteria bacterium]